MERSSRRKIHSWLLEPVDPHILALFRIAFGLFMAFTMIRNFRIGLIENMFVKPAVNFTYDYLGWLHPMPEIYLHLLLAILLLAAAAIAAGVFFRVACWTFAIGYAYIFLLDKSIYNNHIYLFILLAILLSFTQADEWYSLKKKRNAIYTIPRWQILSIQLQIVIVYFYGGIAKLTRHWLVDCEPMRSLLESLPKDHFLSPIINNNAGLYVLNYGGLLLDLGAPFLLWYKPFRNWGVLLFVLFHGMNSRIFTDIGIFPYIMLFSLILFYDAKEIPLLKDWIRKSDPESNLKPEKTKKQNLARSELRIPAFLWIYFVFQLLFPFRGHFLPNPLDWTTIGNRFSWRMKVDTRQVEEMTFTVHSPDLPEPVPVDINTFVNDMQILNLSMDPRSVAQFGTFLKEEVKKYKDIDPAIKAKIIMAYNGKHGQLFVDPEADLSNVIYSPFKKLEWVLPLN